MLIKQITIIALFASAVYSQSIEIIRPLPGEKVPANNQYPITYTLSQSPNNQVNLFYSGDSMFTWEKVIWEYGTGSSQTTRFLWQVPQISSINCFVKVVDFNDSSNYAISGPFTIYPVYYDSCAANEIKYYFKNDGSSSTAPKYDSQGLLWPGRINAYQSAVYRDGFVVTALIDDSVYANGSAWHTGLIPGRIGSDGDPENPADSLFKVWKLKKNWKSLPPGEEKNRLKYDYENWPGNIGAPFIDNDGNNHFNHSIDKPRLIGDETIWFVSNDSDTSRAKNFLQSGGSAGLEYQTTIIAFNDNEMLDDVLFKKIKVINKGTKILKDVAFGYFSDFDLGDAHDDYVGCDTTLNLGYGYNGTDVDNVYGVPPAIGYMILQGPVIKGSNTDSAFFNYGWRNGYRNLGMTSFGPVIKMSIALISDFGTTEGLFNNMRGLTTYGGTELKDPNTGIKTLFGLAGDPVSAIGWYEGEGWPLGPMPCDRRLHVNSGGFELSPGDTNEITFAVIMARGANRLNSVTELKRKAEYVREFYYNNFNFRDETVDGPTSENFLLSQNYPNPFNPITTIEYLIPDTESNRRGIFTKLVVYDVLGQKIAELVNEEQLPGIYKVLFDASRFSSGTYIYRITAGDFNESKKMIVLK